MMRPILWPYLLISCLLFSCGSNESNLHDDGIVVGSIYDGESDSSNSLENVIHYKTNKNSTCTGTIINPYIILTAAHCVHDRDITEVYLDQQYKGSNKKEVETLKKFTPEEFKMKNGGVYPSNDIAVVVLKEKLPFSESKIIKLLDHDKYEDFDISVGDQLTIAGFGKTRSENPQIRQHKDIDIMRRNILCGDRSMKSVWNLDFGAGNGDSGGPAFYKRDNAIYQVGIASAGALLDDNFCRKSYYTNIMPHLNWIKESTGYDPLLTVSEASQAIETKFSLATSLNQEGESHEELIISQEAYLNFNQYVVQMNDPELIQNKFKTRILVEHCTSEDSCDTLSSFWKLKNYINLGKKIDGEIYDLEFPLRNFNSNDEFIRIKLQVTKFSAPDTGPEDRRNYSKMTIDDIDEELIETYSTIIIPANTALNFTQEELDQRINLMKYADGKGTHNVDFKIFLELKS